MRIRFLLHNVYGQGGGVVTVTLALAEELAQRHDVEIVSLFGGGEPVHRLPPGVPVTALSGTGERKAGPWALLRRWAAARPSRLVPAEEKRSGDYSLWSDLALRRYVRSLRGGVLVTMQPGLSIAAAQVVKGRCVLVAQDHRPYRSRPPGLREAYVRHAAGLDAFLTLTRADAVKYRRLLGDRVLIRALPNGTPPYDGPRSSQAGRTVVAAGRLSRSKGFDVLIDAWVAVAQAHPDWRLDIWGEGSLEPELSAQIADRGLQESVRLRGYSRQLQAEMAEASLFVLSSRAEGYPRVILEAMACGLPVVSTACPSGPREMVDTGVDGLLVANEDAAALGRAIIELIDAGAQRRLAMGAAGRAKVEERNQTVIAQRWERLFRRLLDRRAAAGRR